MWIVICTQIPTLQASGRTITLLLDVHSVSDVRQIEIHRAEISVRTPSSFEAELAIAKLKSITHQILITFWQKWFKQVKHYGLRSTDLLILFEIRKNCLISVRGLLLYQYTRNTKRLTVVWDITPINFIQNFIKYPSLKAKSIYIDEIKWGSSLWSLMYQNNYWSDVLHSSGTGEKVGVKWYSASANLKLQEGL
jgi:hypothetical protein